jgi:predicted nucleic acid-binding protein
LRFVLDASVTLGWSIDRPPSPFSMAVLGELRSGAVATVPPIWHLEIANAIIVATRRKFLNPSEADLAVQDLSTLFNGAIETHPDVVTMSRAFQAGRTFGVTPNDATYLLVAIELGLPLATLDKSLQSAATKAGLAVHK